MEIYVFFFWLEISGVEVENGQDFIFLYFKGFDHTAGLKGGDQEKKNIINYGAIDFGLTPRMNSSAIY